MTVDFGGQRFVLDASVAVAWSIATEATPETDHMLYLATRTGVVVPAIWWTEIVNGLIMAGRRGRFSSSDEARFDGMLSSINIQTEAVEPERVVGDVSRLSQRHGLTAYDATYLELALRTNTRLATLDKRLRAASSIVGVDLLTFASSS